MEERISGGAPAPDDCSDYEEGESAMTLRKYGCLGAIAMLGFGFAGAARAATADFSIIGDGITTQFTITYSGSPDANGGYAITGITGTFSDTNNSLQGGGPLNIINATITGLQAINPISPLPVNVIAPDFSVFPIVNGVPSPPAAVPSPGLSYDNTYYPGGSPIVCLDYPASGGPLDVYGVMFTLSNGDVVDVWSNGVFPGSPPGTSFTYGVAVANGTYTYDYVSSVPEASTWAMMALGFAGLGLAGRRAAVRASAAA